MVLTATVLQRGIDEHVSSAFYERMRMLAHSAWRS